MPWIKSGPIFCLFKEEIFKRRQTSKTFFFVSNVDDEDESAQQLSWDLQNMSESFLVEHVDWTIFIAC